MGRRTIVWQAAAANPMKDAANRGGLTFRGAQTLDAGSMLWSA
jgi:hypothetical protein